MTNIELDNIIPEEFLKRGNITCSAEELIEAEMDVVMGTVKSTKTKVVKCISELRDFFNIKSKSTILLENILNKLKENRDFDDKYYALAVTIEQILDRYKFQKTIDVYKDDRLDDTFVDIIATVKTQEILESEERYRTLFENSRDSLMTLSGANFNFSSANSASLKMFNVDTEINFMSLSPWELSPEYQPDGKLSVVKAKEMIDIAIEKGSNFFEWNHSRFNGEIFPATVFLSRMIIDDEVTILANVRDISDLKHKEAEKEALLAQYAQAQKMEAVGTLAVGIAHDFNNLLCVIMSTLELAKCDVDSDSQIFMDISESLNAAKRAADLTKGILAFSRKQVLQISTININIVISEFLSSLRRIVGEDVSIIHEFDENLGNISADASQILSILANLVINARHAMPEGGKLLIKTKNVFIDKNSVPLVEGASSGNFVELSVEDSGTGISPEILSKIFEPFFTTKKDLQGSGLGLSMIHGSVIQQGGFTTVETKLGKGTKFMIYFPTINKRTRNKLITNPNIVLSKGNETILVVEDDPGVRRVAVKILKQCGYEVFEAENAGIAYLQLDKMKQNGKSVDLVLTDIRMPQMSGPDLCKKVSEEFLDTEVIFMSGYPAEAKDDLQGKQFIQKPFNPHDLSLSIRKVLDLKKNIDK